MNRLIKNRVLEEAKYILESNKTVREIAEVFKISKSTVHKDLKYRLKLIDYDMFLKVEKILLFHKKIRHIRGGESTRKKYLNLAIY